MDKKFMGVLCMLAIFVAPQGGCRHDIKELFKECHVNDDCKENGRCMSSGKCSEIGCPTGTVLTDNGVCCKPDSECIKDSDCLTNMSCFGCECRSKNITAVKIQYGS